MQYLKSKILESFNPDELELVLSELNRVNIQEYNSLNLKLAIVELSKGNHTALKELVKLSKRKPQEIINALDKYKEYESYKNDIPIGDGETIKWISFDPKKNTCKEIDELFTPVQSFFNQLETACEKQCCGIRAFNFSSSSIKKESKNFNTKNLLSNFELLSKQIESLEEEILICRGLNQLLHKSVFLKLTKHIKSNLSAYRD